MMDDNLPVLGGAPEIPPRPQPPKLEKPDQSPKWKDVMADPTFTRLSGEAKEQLRQQYFQKIVAPRVDAKEVDEARRLFDSKTKSSTVAGAGEYQFQQAKKGVSTLGTFGPDLLEVGMNATDRADMSPTNGKKMPGNIMDAKQQQAFDARYKPQAPKRNLTTPNKPGDDQRPLDDFKPWMRGNIDQYRDMLNKGMGLDNDKAAPSTGQRLLGAGTEFLAAGGPMSLRSIAARPDRIGKVGQIGRELISSYGGGAMADEAREMAKKSNMSPTGQFIVGLLGGVAGGGGLEMAVPTMGEEAMRKTLTKSGKPVEMGRELEQFQRSKVGQSIDTMIKAEPQSLANMSEAAKVKQSIPGFNPDLATAVGTDTMRSAVKEQSAKNPSVQQAVSSQRIANAEAIQKFQDASFPKTASNVREIVEKDVNNRTQVLDQARAKVEGRINEIKNEITSRGFKRSDGEKLLDLRAQNELVKQGEKSAYYTDLYKMADEAGFKTGSKEIADSINALKNKDSLMFQKMPKTAKTIETVFGKAADENAIKSEIKNLESREQTNITRNRIRDLNMKLKNTEAPNAELNFQQLHSLKKALNQDFRDAKAMGDRTALYQIGELQSVVEKKLQSNEDLYGQLKKADEFFYNEYFVPFQQGGGGRMAHETQFGRNTLEQEIVRKNFMRYKQKGAEDFKKLFGESPEANQLLEAGVLDSLASKVKDKPLNDATIKNFVAENKDFLEQFPELKSKLESRATAVKALDEHYDHLQKLRSGVMSSRMKTLLNSNDYIPVLTKNVNDLSFMSHMKDIAKRDPEAAQAMTHSYAQILGNLDPDKMAPWLTTHQATLKPIFDAAGPQHWDNVLLLSLGNKVFARGAQVAPLKYSIEIDPIKQATGTDAGSLANRFWQMKNGRVGQFWNVATLASRKFFKSRGESYDTLLSRAFSDPEFAQGLINEQYGPALQEAMKNGKTIEEMTKDFGSAPVKKSLQGALYGVKQTMKAINKKTQQYHESWATHAARVALGGTRESAQDQRDDQFIGTNFKNLAKEPD